MHAKTHEVYNHASRDGWCIFPSQKLAEFHDRGMRVVLELTVLPDEGFAINNQQGSAGYDVGSEFALTGAVCTNSNYERRRGKHGCLYQGFSGRGYGYNHIRFPYRSLYGVLSNCAYTGR